MSIWSKGVTEDAADCLSEAEQVERLLVLGREAARHARDVWGGDGDGRAKGKEE